MENFKADFFNTSMIAGVVGNCQLIAYFGTKELFIFSLSFSQILSFGWFGVVFLVLSIVDFFQNATNAAFFQRASRDH